MDIPKQELLELLLLRGYRILIDITATHKTVTFVDTYTKDPYTLSHSYDLTYTDYDIFMDTVYDLLKWTGLKVKYTLDY